MSTSLRAAPALGRKADSPQTDESGRTLRFTQRFTAVVSVLVLVLAAVFFVTTTSNLFLIMNQVQTVKDGPYPVSVAAGRIETLLVQLRTAT